MCSKINGYLLFKFEISVNSNKNKTHNTGIDAELHLMAPVCVFPAGAAGPRLFTIHQIDANTNNLPKAHTWCVSHASTDTHASHLNLS